MKRARIVLVWCVLAPSVAYTQDVRVRLYTVRPPDALSVRGLGGDVHWRRCTLCAESAGRELSVRAGDEKDGAEIFVTGHYELRLASGPLFSGSYPTHTERRAGRLLVTVTMPLERRL